MVTVVSQLAQPIGTVEAAEILGWSISKVKREAKALRLPAYKMAGRTGGYVFDRQVIETIAANRQKAESAA